LAWIQVRDIGLFRVSGERIPSRERRTAEIIIRWRVGELSAKDAARALVDILKDPTDPENQLPRASNRVCPTCGRRYRTNLRVMAALGCSDICREIERRRSEPGDLKFAWRLLYQSRGGER
jgi:hypothetical protein